MVERTEDGKFHPYVMDFGLARETAGAEHSRSGVIEGTPRFMSPEQARGDTKHLDRRTDVYSLGVSLYEILIGRSPYEATGAMDFLLAVLTTEPKPLRVLDPNFPVDLEAVTLKCMEKEPAARYDSAKALADDLGRYLDGDPVLARRIGLTQRLYRRARRHKALVALGAALLVSLLGLMAYGVRTRLATLEREQRARRQAELAQRLGQEISKMEWMLRSARQLPLHDLGREKQIVRKRMDQLQKELAGYGGMGRGLAHYALGRGRLALHEYPEALAELRQALDQGNQSADVHYALGIVMGKQYEQAMYEARLSGGGDWAKKQLKEIEPKYLVPAIESLQKSREMQTDAPAYLEALLAYYQKEYELGLKRAEVAELEAPWLYEAAKLRGDIHQERALQARDSGKSDEADREFAAAVKSYKEAAAVGQSDGEVYEGLAESWVRQIETALIKGQPTEVAYAEAVAASDKLSRAEPGNVAGKLKKAYASLMTMALMGAGLGSEQRVKQCLAEAGAVLDKEPENPYARDVAAGCNAFAADGVQGKGEDPEPLYRKALSLLEPAVQRNPHFLWGLNDLAGVYLAYASFLQLHGNPAVKELFEKTLHYEGLAVALDETYVTALQNILYTWAKFVAMASAEPELQTMLGHADDALARCKKVNSQFQQCDINYLQIYSRAAQRTQLAGGDPQSRLSRAMETLGEIRKLGGKFLDAEQHAALAHLVAASQKVRKKQSPEAELEELNQAVKRCLEIAAQDAMCRTLAAQGEWVQADWLGPQKKRNVASLKAALKKAQEATTSPETYPDAWQAVAESYLRLASGEVKLTASGQAAVAAGLLASDKVFAINPNHALGRATQGALELWRAQREGDAAAKQGAAGAAVKALRQALQGDPLLAHDYAPLLVQAQALAVVP